MKEEEQEIKQVTSLLCSALFSKVYGFLSAVSFDVSALNIGGGGGGGERRHTEEAAESETDGWKDSTALAFGWSSRGTWFLCGENRGLLALHA